MRLRLCLCFFIGLAASVHGHAQNIGPSTLDAAGGSATIPGIIHEYAVGQLLGDSYVSPSLVVTPGVLQPLVNSNGVAGIIAAGQLGIFPDPVENVLFIHPAFRGSGLLQYSLYDAAGKLALEGQFPLTRGNEPQSIPMPDLAAGQYLLKMVWQAQGTSWSSGYKIEKIR